MFDTSQISLHGLTVEEFDLAIETVGRPINMVELGILSAMWSEHCSYKSSKLHLKTLPTAGPQVIEGPGENAGVVDIGDGYAVVFKMESHNHPSFIEPYQGAGTGVGGILRDVFTMGARPIASLNSLRFGELSNPRTRYLVDGTVAGIAGYGNCMGVPTVGGEISFHKSYNGNCLVNAFNLGLVKKDKIFLGKAEGAGNPVMYVGAKTGRDGIHGATMASEEFGEGSEERRPTVQVGDPFTEKLLLEACLELFKTDYVVGIQDMGAAGMTSSSFEMAGRAGTGLELDLDKIPRREEGMNAYEIMLSESQERMLLVCRQGAEEKVKNIFAKWDLSAEVVGVVTDDGMVRLYENGEIAAELPALPLSEKAPAFRRLSLQPVDLPARRTLADKEIPEPADLTETLLRLIGSPNLCSKEWAYRQYDHMVRTNTIEAPGSDSAVVRIKGTNKAIAMSLDCNSRYCYLDPYIGGMQAVAEATRNVACSGATPLAITDCLNFGSPENHETMWHFESAIKGISAACLALDTPVVSGNVSFYNQTGDKAIYPTPTIGAVGLLEDHTKVQNRFFKNSGDTIILLGETGADIGGSEYLAFIHDIERGMPPSVELDKEAKLQQLLTQLADKRLVSSMGDISDGGLAVALAKCCFGSDSPNLGFEISLDIDIRKDFFLFSESQSRIVISCVPRNADKVINAIKNKGLHALIAGKVIPRKARITLNGEISVDSTTLEIMKPWSETLPLYMSR